MKSNITDMEVWSACAANTSVDVSSSFNFQNLSKYYCKGNFINECSFQPIIHHGTYFN
jgi:hypothetical protein